MTHRNSNVVSKNQLRVVLSRKTMMVMGQIWLMTECQIDTQIVK